MDKKTTVVHPDSGMLFSTKKKCAISHEKTQRKLKYMLSERNQSEKVISFQLYYTVEKTKL